MEKDNKIEVDDDNDDDEVENTTVNNSNGHYVVTGSGGIFEPNGGFDDGIHDNEIGDEKTSDNNEIEVDNDYHDVVQNDKVHDRQRHGQLHR
jgi:hypothetical protein